MPTNPSLAGSMCYGSVRAALSLGTHEREQNNESETQSGGTETVLLPPRTTSSDSEAFWKAIRAPEEFAPSTESLLQETVLNARASLQAQNAKRKECPNRKRVEQDLVDRWRRSSTAEDTPLPNVEPIHPSLDPLVSPF